MGGPEADVEPLPPLELPGPGGRRRWVGWAALAACVAASLACVSLGWGRVLPHLVSTAKLDSYGIAADWSIGRDDWDGGGHTEVRRKIRWRSVSPEMSQHLLGLHRVTNLTLDNCASIGDSVLPSIAKLAELEDLTLDRSSTSDPLEGQEGVTDRGLASLAALKKLRHLQIRYSSVTDAGLDALAGMTALEDLDLRGSAITDAGLEKLARLPRLRSLDVSDTAITDAGLARLKSFGQLSFLLIEETDTTPAAIDDLRQSLPPGAVLVSGGKRPRADRRGVSR